MYILVFLFTECCGKSKKLQFLEEIHFSGHKHESYVFLRRTMPFQSHSGAVQKIRKGAPSCDSRGVLISHVLIVLKGQVVVSK